MLFQLSHALFQRALVLFQQQPTLGRGGVSLAAQLGEARHLRAWHAGVAQSQQQLDPRDVARCVASVAARRASNWFEQPDTLVVSERVDTQARLLRNLLDGKCCCLHSEEYETWSALQVKSLRESNGELP